MGLRANPVNFRARGVTDAIDGTVAAPGSMKALQNLIPNPANAGQFVPRAASSQLSNFSGFATPGVPNALLIVGNFAWGMVPSARFAGRDEPFCYDIANAVFVTIANVTAANCPLSPLTTGDWTPPTMAMITNGRIMISHPGYDGVNTFVGWLDISAFTSNTITGTTHTTTTLDTLSSNPILAGWQVGMAISGPDIPAGTYIVSMTAAAVVLSQAAVGGHAGGTYTVTGGTAVAPLYGAGNLNGNPLAGVATCVALFSSRAWYGYKNFAIYSDTLNPTQVTNAAQALQIGDNLPVTALAGLPLTSQVNGGTLQSLIVFKGSAAFTQVTGDAATNNLTANAVNGSVGTLAPNTICATPGGLAFVAPDGLRVLGLDGVIQPTIGSHGTGVSLPFENAQFPSRMCAAYNTEIVRITVQDPLVNGAPFQEWWYDLRLDIWTGPHTFPNALIRPYFGTTTAPFVHVGVAISGKLWASYADPPINVSYTENGTPLVLVWQSTLLPDNQGGQMNCISAQSTLGLQIPAGEVLTVLATDEGNNVLDTVYLNGPATGGSIWNSFNWGAGAWGYTTKPFQQVAINWNLPFVFKQAALQITGPAMAGLILGDFNALVQPLGYMIV